jgi:hypothetical protein
MTLTELSATATPSVRTIVAVSGLVRRYAG